MLIESFRSLVVCVAVIAGLVVVAFNRNSIYVDEVSVWTDITEKSPYKGRAFDALGFYYLSVKDYNKAIYNFSEAVRRHRYYPQLYIDLAKAYEVSGDITHAIDCVQSAISIVNIAGIKQTNYHIYLGELYFKELNLTDAQKEFAAAIQDEPGDSGLYHKIGLVARARGDYDEAIKNFDKAIELSPEITTYREDRDNVLLLKKQKHKG